VIFVQFCLGRESQVGTLIPNFTVLDLICGPTASKIVKNSIFLYKFAPMGKIWGSTEKVEYRCTNLPLCNDTINVLKNAPLHNVSVITNFVIPKRDKQKNKLEINMHHLRGNAITGRPREEAILTKSCVVVGFVTQRPKTILRFS